MESAALSLLSHEVPTTWLHIMVETAHASPVRSPQEFSCTLCRGSFLTGESWTVFAIAQQTTVVLISALVTSATK